MNMTAQMFRGYIIFNLTNPLYLKQDVCTNYEEMNFITRL